MVKFFLTITFFAFSTYALDSNPYFKTEAEVDRFFVDSSISVPDGGRGGFSVEIKNGHRIVETGNSCLCREDWGASISFDWDADSIIGGNGYILGIEFGDGDKLPTLDKNKSEKAKIAFKYLIRKYVSGYIDKSIYKNALKSYKNNSKSDAVMYAKEVLSKTLWTFDPINNNNVAVYNDLGFFLEQGGSFDDVVILLEQVIKAVPTRTVAYINLGDAYFGLHNQDKAKSAYTKYVELIKKEGNENKIPQRVLDRIKA